MMGEARILRFSPTPGICYMGGSGGRSSVVERQLPKLNVVGSIPIARSIPLSHHFCVPCPACTAAQPPRFGMAPKGTRRGLSRLRWMLKTRDTADAKSMRYVLVVEDEPLIRMYVCGILEDSGFDVLEAATAEEALEIVETRSGVRVVVSDVDMPGAMDGFELARKLVDDRPRLGVVLVSGVADPGEAELPTGVRFISKPVWASTLLRLVRQTASPGGSQQPPA